MANPSLYASREGALYQSYDNFAGGAGLYDPSQNASDSAPQPPAGVAPMQQAQPAHYQQQAFAQFYREQPVYQQPMTAYMPQYASQQYTMSPMMAQPAQNYQPAQSYQQHGMSPQPPAPVAPIQYGPELRGVGIKFGERIDPRSGGMLVYVKRLVRDGPADQCKRIQPGDVLQLIDGEDIYGQGLDILRDKIPGPAGTSVNLGFRSYAGQLYEVDLQRTAYGDKQPEATQVPAAAQYFMPRAMMPQAHKQYVAQVPQQPQYFMAAPRQQYMMPQSQPVQYIPQYAMSGYQTKPSAVQYVAAPRDQVQFQQYQYQPVQYQQAPAAAPQMQSQYMQPPSQQYPKQAYYPPAQAAPSYYAAGEGAGPAAAVAAPGYAPAQTVYADHFAYQQQPYSQQPLTAQQPPQSQPYSQPSAMQSSGYGDYGDDYMQGTQV